MKRTPVRGVKKNLKPYTYKRWKRYDYFNVTKVAKATGGTDTFYVCAHERYR